MKTIYEAFIIPYQRVLMIIPKHYTDTKLMDLLIEKRVPFAEANIMKYVFRWREKDGMNDLYKARTYLEALIAFEELHLGS